MNILAFGASNKKQSINKQFASFVAYRFAELHHQDSHIDIIDLNDYEMPLFNEDKQKISDVPIAAKTLCQKFSDNDLIIISFAEHNGIYTAAYKNILDWCSIIKRGIFCDKPMILLATSPGSLGGKSVLNFAVQSTPNFAGIVKGSFSLPKFYDNFNTETQKISNTDMLNALDTMIKDYN